MQLQISETDSDSPGSIEGSQTPRIWTPRDEQFDTLGPLMAGIAEIADIDLDEWQHLVAGCALEHHPDGTWVHRTICVLVARQNGKTIILEARILLGLFVLPERLILHTAQDRTLPRELFEDLSARISDTRALHKRLARRGIRETNGQERIRLKDGSTYRILAPRPKAFRGPSADLIIFDEVREHTDTDLWGAAYPTQSALPNPQIWAASNEGDAEAVQLHRLQDRGRAAAEHPELDRKICYLEWSAHPDRTLDDHQGWAEANPSLGDRITLETIAEERVALDDDKFATERLCRSVKRLKVHAIPWPAWERCGGDPGELEAGLPRPQMAVHINGDRTHAALAMIAKRDDRLIADVVEEWRNPDGIDLLAVTADVLAYMREYKVRDLAFDRAAASVVANAADQKAFETHRIDATEFIVASQNLFDAVTTGYLFHRNNPELNAQIEAAGRRDSRDGTWYISQAASSEQIPAVLALAFAVNLAYRPTRKGGFRSLE